MNVLMDEYESRSSLSFGDHLTLPRREIGHEYPIIYITVLTTPKASWTAPSSLPSQGRTLISWNRLLTRKKRPSLSPHPSHRQSRSSLPGSARSPVSADSQQTFALGPTGVPLIRRDSMTVGDGRPKRKIHPPAPRDLPSSHGN